MDYENSTGLNGEFKEWEPCWPLMFHSHSPSHFNKQTQSIIHILGSDSLILLVNTALVWVTSDNEIKSNDIIS